MATLTINLTVPRTALVETIVDLLATRLRERGGPEVALTTEPADLVLAIRPGIGAEGFTIEGAPGEAIRIVGNDERGLLYGIGKFLRTCRYVGGFTLSAWRGVSVPAKPMRGIYFATHFHNFYHDGPVEAVERYIEDLALWGYNTLAVWFDLHHYSGIDDPAAQAMIARLRVLLTAAQRVGMGLSLTTLTNEGYQTTPEALRAKDTRLGFYQVEVCPATPEGETLCLRNARDRLEAFADLAIDSVWQWPYDQGGCTCEHCHPWGSNGMVRLAEQQARQVFEFFPHAKIIYSTWLFDYYGDQGEWVGLDRAFTSRPDWVHYLMADSHTTFPRYPLEQGVPGDLPMLNFPEISMWGMLPWGGFGANPLVRRFTALWASMKDHSAGGFPYSEGLFEDVNKVCYAGFYWTGEANPDEALAEYAGYELGTDDIAVVRRLLVIQEDNHAPIWSSTLVQPHQDAAKAEEALAIADRLDTTLPAWARTGWRWRILALRARLDREIITHGDVTPACEPAFEELIRIYGAEQAEWSVCPPAASKQLVKYS